MSGPPAYLDTEKDFAISGEGDGSMGDGSSKEGATVVAGEVLEHKEQTTERGLKSRHAQMIALGGKMTHNRKVSSNLCLPSCKGSIGTGLFVGSGQTLARGGPAFILGSYIFMSFLVLCLVTGIGELSAWLPTPGCSMNM